MTSLTQLRGWHCSHVAPRRAPRATAFGVIVMASVALLAAPQDPQPAPPPQGQSEVALQISGDIGAPPRYAVPDFIALTSDAETATIARTLAEVLWNDLAFEREFYLIPRDTYKTIPAARSPDNVPFDRWRELGADGLIVGTAQKTATGITVEARLFNVRSRQVAMARAYDGSLRNSRLIAHTISDEIHQQQRGLRGVARTKLTFSSDRDQERLSSVIGDRTVKEIYITDYDGANPQRVTTSRNLNVFPTWSPDGRGIAYVTYQWGAPDIVVSMIYQGTRDRLTDGKSNNVLPVFSPDGTRICFSSTRDGNNELYVMNRDGSGVRRLTNHPAADITPTWSPTGNQIAFTSDRSGTPQIWIVDADGLNLRRLTYETYADRATWSPAPFNEIAFSFRSGPGIDIKIVDLATRQTRQLTFGEGSNESPAYAPNGRHIAFASSRAGKYQIFTVGRDGRGLAQITRVASNTTPDWSR